MTTAAGLFVITTDNKVLICHPTNAPFTEGWWSIPKGTSENQEQLVDTAIRETKEETGIDVTLYKDTIIELGKFVYTSGKKQLHAFVIYIPQSSTALDSLQCSSMVTLDDRTFPEIDKFQWVDKEVGIELLHEAAGSALLTLSI